MSLVFNFSPEIPAFPGEENYGHGDGAHQEPLVEVGNVPQNVGPEGDHTEEKNGFPASGGTNEGASVGSSGVRWS